MKSMQKSSSLILTLVLVACTAFVPGCTEQVDEVFNGSEQTDVGAIDFVKITNVNWQWAGLVGTPSVNQSVVPNNESYTLEFLPSGTYLITTECNSGSGNYTVDGNSLTLAPGMITLAYCGPESLEPQYLSLLGIVTSMTLEDGQLLLSLGNNSEKMLFINAESVQ